MPKNINRRSFMKHSLVAGGTALALHSFEEKVLSAEIDSAKKAGTAAPSVSSVNIPKGKIKDLEISRVICGGNLIGGWAHSRDLMYVSPLIKAYHTDEKVLETFKLAEQRGINTFLTNPITSQVISKYRKEGGKLLWISDGGSSKEAVKRSLDGGADAVYFHGGVCDSLVQKGQMKVIEETLSFMKDQMIPCGIGAHCLESVRKCVEAGFDPDFWVKTLHKDTYWSATPEQNRKPFDEINGAKKEHDGPHDNMFCINAKETIEFMATLKKPWIAFKTLAAGAIHPRDSFQWCFENGADFICVGMFDFQVVEDTDIAEKALKTVVQKGRARPWMA
ncbi:MAG: hypothetical protein PHR77_06790 [Kiritimatiellae bacterium]|nr:hypothetical protein [Kiritimatiellia bacterium]MDD5521955.1 hypothetical protein [Kiritimatiellia bacterium]